MDEDELWIGWSDITSKDIDNAMAEVIKRGWQEDEWFAGFEQMVKRSEPDADDTDHDADMEDEDKGISEKLHIQRADTMFQSRWDMTEQKRREYVEWKNKMLQRIEEIERSQTTDMEVDSAA
jgi:origin recognition complex subunit 6